MRSLLITGGAGFIGGNFTHYWTEHHPGDRVTVLDALTYAGNVETIRPLIDAGAIVFEQGDITSLERVTAIMERDAIDTVVHFAAESHVDRSIADPLAFVRTNMVGTAVLLDAARRTWTNRGDARMRPRFHHVSTDEVYGSLTPDAPAFTERTPYAPNSPYAASKAGADHLVRAAAHTYGLPVSISNCSNNYGPYQHPEKLIPLTIVNALHGRPIPVYGDGQQVRDWLHVADHCVALDRIITGSVEGETFNVGGNAECVNLELVRMICTSIDARISADAALAARYPGCPAARGGTTASLVTHVTDRPGHDRRYAIDAAKLRAMLAFEPSHTIASGLARTVDWYLENEAWWRPIIGGAFSSWVETQYPTSA